MSHDNKIFDQLNFRHTWRPYQQRVLDAIEQHLDDQRLHVVAAPGAGKTTLGLEVFRRLQKPAIVLSPTRVIRDQWLQRLDDFCDVVDSSTLDWVSNDIHAPKTLTSITYQALHAQLSADLDAEEDEENEAIVDGIGDEPVNDNELNGFVQLLKKHDIGVIIMDEAHHLRSEWWRAITKTLEELPHTVLVSLTATPPYDAQNNEWAKYETLCGPIDEEISVPELVKAGTLCTHQDFIWAVNVSPTEKQRIKEYDERVERLCEQLFHQKDFNDLVLSHPWVNETITEQEILKDPEVAISILVFMKARSHPVPVGLCQMMDITAKDVPDLGRKWWQVLIEAVLFSKLFISPDVDKGAVDKSYVDQLKKELRSLELLRKRELTLEKSRRVERSLSMSSAKIDACVAVHKLEYKHRGDALRQVILTDFIRDEMLHKTLDTDEVNLGAWPIFKSITSTSLIHQHIGLLTGRLSVIHNSLLETLLALVDSRKIKVEPLGDQTEYLKINGPLNLLTQAFTALLMQGHINTLVGTRALLGEGWDAPAINSLVLASAVGSFMLTNQMRGRAIRLDKNAPEKVSSIWHLVAIDTKSYSGYSDYGDLKKRFETFVGLSEKNSTIESGFERLHATGFKYLEGIKNQDRAVFSNNRQMLGRYVQRLKLKDRWQDALTLNESARILPSVLSPKIPGIRAYHVKNTMGHLLFQIGLALTFVVSFGLHVAAEDFSAGLFVLGIGSIGVLLYKLPKTIGLVRILLKHLPVDGALKQIGIALAEALCQTGLIETSYRRLKVDVLPGHDGTFYLMLSGSTFYESSLFADSLAEILAPIESPRYLVIRAGEVYGMKRDDYHAVPIKLATKKESAQIFYKAWCKYVGPSELIYTRHSIGRARLLKAKMRAFSNIFSRTIKREDRWQ